MKVTYACPSTDTLLPEYLSASSSSHLPLSWTRIWQLLSVHFSVRTETLLWQVAVVQDDGDIFVRGVWVDIQSSMLLKHIFQILIYLTQISLYSSLCFHSTAQTHLSDSLILLQLLYNPAWFTSFSHWFPPDILWLFQLCRSLSHTLIFVIF